MDLFDALAGRNPGLVAAAAALHQSGELPPDCYVVDVEAVEKNARLVSEAVEAAGLDTFFEAKEFGRCPPLCALLGRHGFVKALAIDVEELYALERQGVRVGHVGHLGQIPSGDVEHVVADTRPDVITVYSFEKAAEIDAAARRAGRVQQVALRVNGPDDHVPLSIAGGVGEDAAIVLAKAIATLAAVELIGLTTYPVARFDLARREWVTTANLATMLRMAERLERELGTRIGHINAAGNVCAATARLVADAGATHCEPGQAFVGGLVANGFVEQAEVPAIAYVTEVSHLVSETPFVYAASMVANATIGIWNALDYDSLHGAISRPGLDPLAGRVRSKPQFFASSDPTAFIYNAVQPLERFDARVGDTVVFGFRTQLYRTNGARLAVLEGIAEGRPRIAGFYDRTGNPHADRTGAPR